MALNLLTIEEMVYVTQPLVDPADPTRTAIMQVPGMDAVMPHIEEAYEGLLVAMDKGRVQSLAEIGVALQEADNKHDGLARTVFYALEAHHHLARAYGEEETAEALLQVQNFLFPQQLRVVELSYRDEAGQAHTLARNITSTHEEWLAGIPMPGGSLLDTMQAWLAAGVELGELERQRNSVDVPGRRLRVNRARSRWGARHSRSADDRRVVRARRRPGRGGAGTYLGRGDGGQSAGLSVPRRGRDQSRRRWQAEPRSGRARHPDHRLSRRTMARRLPNHCPHRDQAHLQIHVGVDSHRR